MPGPEYRIVDITPLQATRLIEQRRPHARRIAAAVRDYAQSMRDGRWILNGMPLILSCGGVLLDGVQRLHACMESGVGFRTLLAERVSDDVLHTIDQQRRRSFAHVLEARGLPHAHAVTAALRRLLDYEAGPGSGSQAPWAQLDRLLEANPGLPDAVVDSLEVVGPPLPEPVRSPLLFMGRCVDAAATARFFDALVHPASHPPAEPGVQLRAELDRAAAAGLPLRRDDLFALSIRALNASIRGEATVIRARAAAARGNALPRLAGYRELARPPGGAVAPGLTPAEPGAEAGEGLSVRIEWVDRAAAERLLRGNTANRQVMQAHVDGIARDIRAGRWMLNAQPICLAASGRLLNGQHRLLAVIAAGVPIEVPIARGVPEEAFGTYDRHAKRGPELGGALDCFGDRALVAAMANLFWRHELRPAGRRQAKATAAEIHAILEAHPRLLELRRFARKMVDHGRSSVLGYGAYVIERESPALARAFLRSLETGAGLPDGHPVLGLRRTLQRLRRAGASQDEQLEAMLDGWTRFKAREAA